MVPKVEGSIPFIRPINNISCSPGCYFAIDILYCLWYYESIGYTNTDMIDLNKYTDLDKSTVFHSSGHARLDRGEQQGSTSVQQTFERRTQVNAQRIHVKAYRSSAIGARTNGQRSLTYKEAQVRRQQQASPQIDASPVRRRQEMNATGSASTGQKPPSGTRQPTFQEPQRRGYNPYG